MPMSLLSAATRWVVCAGLATFCPIVAYAETPASSWQWDATVYVWLPSLSGDTSFPTGGGGPSLDVDADAILDSLNFAFMGAIGARKGPWGVATDIIYLDLGASKRGTREFGLGRVELPASVSADLRLDLTGWLWTTAGSYTVVDSDRVHMDVFAGARMFDLEQTLGWKLNGDISTLPLPGRNGGNTVEATQWDAIAGVKGRATFGADSTWFVPYLVDVGTGDSDLTWQAMIGLGYAFQAVDVKAVWRYLEYDFGNDSAIQSLDFNGPAVGVTYRF